jgi:hypothetical protein
MGRSRVARERRACGLGVRQVVPARHQRLRIDSSAGAAAAQLEVQMRDMLAIVDGSLIPSDFDG